MKHNREEAIMAKYLSDVLYFLPKGNKISNFQAQSELNEVYEWMQKRGLLNDAWVLKKTKNHMLFTVAIEDLVPYEPEMRKAFQGNEQALKHIQQMFNDGLPLCKHCGAISLSQPMVSARINAGEREIRCDCVPCSMLTEDILYRMGTIFRLQGSRSAIQWGKEMLLYEK